ncbi:hypothetical protein BBP40_002349 [Aspergillus hancockii]|nr:hypothetical protein BBP40_002349 [Aspergillus hancockii]
MLEPCGHDDMYGAIIIPDTELVQSDDAQIGTLFTHTSGVSTMCGHATIALGRFLVDTHDLSAIPRREEIKVDPVRQGVVINHHAPCGVVRITVPTTFDGRRSDPPRGCYVSLYTGVRCSGWN